MKQSAKAKFKKATIGIRKLSRFSNFCEHL